MYSPLSKTIRGTIRGTPSKTDADTDSKLHVYFFSCSHEFSVDTGILFASSFCIFIHAYLGFCVADYEDCYIAPVNVQFMSTYN